jgi:hypothetical protein
MMNAHKVTVGRVYFIDAQTPYEAMEKAIERDKSDDGLAVDAIELRVVINPEDD